MKDETADVATEEFCHIKSQKHRRETYEINKI